MGLTTGKLTGAVFGGVNINFKRSGTPMGAATTAPDGTYSIYLAAGFYTADVNGNQCHENTFNIPSSTKIQNLSY